jgi:hypothetical protein
MIKVPSLELTLDVSFDTEREHTTFMKRLNPKEHAQLKQNEELTFRKGPTGGIRNPQQPLVSQLLRKLFLFDPVSIISTLT